MLKLKKWFGKVHREQLGAINSNLVSVVIVAAIAMVVAGIGISIGGPAMLTGFEAMRTNTAVGNYTSLATVITAGPTLMVLGFIIVVAIVGFLGIQMAKSKDS